MARSRLAWLALVACITALPASCSPEIGLDVDDAGHADVGDGCIPNCHWDCFGSTPRCSEGAIVARRGGARPCCRPTDFTPATACPDEELIRCREGCSDGDPRYPRPEKLSHLFEDEELRQAFCAEGINRRPGDPCSGDIHCRPAAEGVGRLECDDGSRTCVEVERPPAPPELFQHCGLTSHASAETVKLVKAPNCEVCLVLTPEDRCASQACSMLCQFDEDCPAGSSCSCAGLPPFPGTSSISDGRGGACYCIPATEDRFDATPDWLVCR